MKPAIEIRPATIDDYDAVCALIRQLDAHHVEILPDNFQSFEGPVRLVERIRDKVSSPDKALFVAVSQSVLVGFVDVQQESNPPYPMLKQKTFGLIDGLFVIPELRGTGVAQALLERAKAWARDCGLSSIRLKVYSANSAAVKFYQREGLVPFSTMFETQL